MLIANKRIPVKEILLTGFLPNFLKKLVYRLKGSSQAGSILHELEGDHVD